MDLIGFHRDVITQEVQTKGTKEGRRGLKENRQISPNHNQTKDN